MNSKRCTNLALALAGVVQLCACGGSSHGYDRFAVDAITITPDTARVQPGGTLRFSAEVVGTGALPVVTWRVDTASGDSRDAGWISADGTYHAPERPPESPFTIRIFATCPGDPTSGVASVIVPSPAIVLAGGASSALVDDTLRFTATVDGSTDQRVEWSASAGRIDGDGLYTAPAAVWTDGNEDVVRARSPGTGLEAEAHVAIHMRPPMLTQLSGPAGPGEVVTIRGTRFHQVYGTAGEATVLFPAAVGAPISTLGTALTDDTLTVKVPIGAVAGPLAVSLPPSGVTSDPIAFERAPRLRLHVPRGDVAAGEALPVRVAVLGVAGPVPLDFSADAGSFLGDRFVAPFVDAFTWIGVRACVSGTAICSAATVGVHPFVIDPSPAVVPRGGALALSALTGAGPIPAAFSLASGGGAVSPDGAYAVSTALADAGEAWVVANNDGTRAEYAPVVVSGGIPGELARVAVEYRDERAADPARGLPSGTFTHSIAVAGARAWVLASDATVNLLWIDAYDVSDPLHPEWLGATESATPTARLALARGRLYALSDTMARGRAIAAYDVTGPLPTLAGRVERPVPPRVTRILAPLTLDADHVVDAAPPEEGAGTMAIRIFSLADPSLSTWRETSVSFPAEANVRSWMMTFASRDGRAYATYPGLDGSWRLGAWDLSTDPATFVGSTEGRDAGGQLSFPGPLLLDGACLFDRREPVPPLVGCLPSVIAGRDAVGSDGDRHLLAGKLQAYVLDLTDPLAPRLDASFPGGPGAVASGRLYEATGDGIAVRDLSPGGPIPRAQVWIEDVTSSLNGTAVRGDRLYVAGYNFLVGGFLATVDLRSSPPAVEAISPLSTAGLTLALDGERLLVGAADALEVRLAADPHAPPIASLPLDVFSIAVDGDLAWVGTIGGDLVAVDLAADGGPAELGRLALGARARRIGFAGPGRLALALQSLDYASGDLAIVDGSVPRTPLLVATMGLDLPVFDVALDGPTAVLATPAGLVTVDVSDPARPTALALVQPPRDLPQAAWAPPMFVTAEVHEGVTWAGSNDLGCAVLGYDVRDPRRPREVARWAPADAPTVKSTIVQVAFDGPRMVVSRSFEGNTLRWNTLEVLDATQPRNVLRQWSAPVELRQVH